MNYLKEFWKDILREPWFYGVMWGACIVMLALTTYLAIFG